MMEASASRRNEAGAREFMSASWGVAVLTCLAGAPVLALTILAWSDPDAAAANSAADRAITWCALLVVFFCGARAGLVLGPVGSKRLKRDFAISLSGPVVGFLAILLPVVPGIALVATGLLLQGVWDLAGSESGEVPDWYMRTRMIVAAILVVLLLVILIRLLLPY